MTKAMERALAARKVAPATPDTDTPSLTLVDCIAGEPQNWVERAQQRKPLRPAMRIRAGKPKARHANKLDRLCTVRRRSDKRYPGAVNKAPGALSEMRRSGYVVKVRKETE